MQSHRTVGGIHVQHQMFMELFPILCTWMLFQVNQLHYLVIYVVSTWLNFTLWIYNLVFSFVLVLKVPIIRNKGKYHNCRNANIEPVHDRTFVLKDPSVVIQPEDFPTVRGRMITLSCGVVGSTSVNVKWLQNGSDLPGDKLISLTHQLNEQDVQVHTLTIKKTKRRHLGKYNCIVTNAKGSAKSRTAQVFFSSK